MGEESPIPAPPKRGSEVVFYGFVAILVIAVFGGAVYLMNGRGSAKDDTPSPWTVRNPATSAAATHSTAGGSRAGAVAVVRKNFRLALAGKDREACALESPAYLRFDTGTYGGCGKGARALREALAARGTTFTVTSVKLRSFTGSEATVLIHWAAGAKHGSENVYVQVHDGRWWITGADDSGDLGYE